MNDEFIPESRDRYFQKDEEYLGIHEDEFVGSIWMNAYTKDWKFIASLARLNSFDGMCEDLLADGYTEVTNPISNQ